MVLNLTNLISKNSKLRAMVENLYYQMNTMLEPQVGQIVKNRNIIVWAQGMTHLNYVERH